MPHISVLPLKPEPIAAEMKCVADVMTEIMLFLEMMEGKERMAKRRHHADLGATAACSVRLMEDARLCHKGRVLLGDSWFASVKAAVALHKRGVYFIGPVKNNIKRFA